MPPLNKFTSKAKDAVRRAHEIAIERGQNHVTPQHLMLALLLGEDENTIVLMLENQNIDYVLLTDFLFELVDGNGGSQTLTPSYQMFLTKELAEVFVKSQEVAALTKDSFISTEHLFLATLESKDEKTLEILKSFSIDKNRTFDIFKKIKAGNIKIVIKRRNKFLQKFTKDLTLEAENGNIDPVIGREEEISKMIEIISRRSKSNPVLVGDPGVGKTAIVEGFAQRLFLKNVPDNLINKKLHSLDLGQMIAGTKFRGEFEERLKGVLKEVEDAEGEIILFIDEMHMLMGAGGADGAIDASNLLKPALARKNFSLIGATTFAEHQKFVQKDGAFTRRFAEIKILEPSVSETVDILKGLQKTYEIYHSVEITDGAILAAAKLSDRYISDRKLPDKALDLLDVAAAKIKILNFDKPSKLKIFEKEIKKLKLSLSKKRSKRISKKDLEKIKLKIDDLKEESRKIELAWETRRELHVEEKNIFKAISILKNELKLLEVQNKNNNKFEKNSEHVAEDFEKKVIKKISEIKNMSLPMLEKRNLEINKKLKSIENKSSQKKKIVNKDIIAKVVSEQTGISVGKMIESNLHKLKTIEIDLAKEIIGQGRAIKKVSNAIKISQLGISDPNKPSGSFIFLGQTGTGKTELAKEIALNIFEKKESFIRVDMQELMEAHSVSKLIGSPPGYVGYESGGGLTEKVRNNPYSIILFDEIEKANPEISNILLKILDEGEVTDAKGRVVNFRNSIIIMTSNIGSEFFAEVGSIGFDIDVENEKLTEESKKKKEKEARKNIINSLNDYFSPEFLNRIDEKIIFNTLTKKDIKNIVKLQIKKQKDFLKEKLILKITSRAINEITERSFSQEFGAREVKRVVKRKILNKLAEFMVENNNPQTNEFRITFSVDFKKSNSEEEKKGEFIYAFSAVKRKLKVKKDKISLYIKDKKEKTKKDIESEFIADFKINSKA